MKLLLTYTELQQWPPQRLPGCYQHNPCPLVLPPLPSILSSAQSPEQTLSSWTSPSSARGMPGTATEDCVTPRKAHGPACNHHSGPTSWEEGPPTGKAKTCPPHSQFCVLNYRKCAPRPCRKEAPRPQMTVLVAKQMDRRTRTALPGRYTGLHTAWHGEDSKTACQTDMWDVGCCGSESSSRHEGSWECQYPKHSPGV